MENPALHVGLPSTIRFNLIFWFVDNEFDIFLTEIWLGSAWVYLRILSKRRIHSAVTTYVTSPCMYVIVEQVYTH